MKVSEWLYLAAEKVQARADEGRYLGCCVAIAGMRTFENHENYIATDTFFWDNFRPLTITSSYWMGELGADCVNDRVLALLFASELAKDMEERNEI